VKAPQIQRTPCNCLQALELLNALLLAPQAATPPPIARHTNTDRGRAVPANAQIAMRNSPNVVLEDDSTDADAAAIADRICLSTPTAGGASCSSEPSWSAVWGRDDDLFGPDLSTFEVPCDGHSCVGLEVGELPRHGVNMSEFSTDVLPDWRLVSAACGVVPLPNPVTSTLWHQAAVGAAGAAWHTMTSKTRTYI